MFFHLISVVNGWYLFVLYVIISTIAAHFIKTGKGLRYGQIILLKSCDFRLSPFLFANTKHSLNKLDFSLSQSYKSIIQWP